ncbi:MAG: hypothetical protein KDD37_03120 [Bdellovibrionales bacterium]|nr:hypothetical protein [Bdellovibrionales bacterium]
MRYVAILSLFLFATNAKALQTSEALVTPFYGYGVINFLGGGKVPTFNGHYYGVEGEYKFVGETLSLGFTGAVSQGSFDNDANNEVETETLDLTGHRFGLKLYYHDMYLKAGYGFVSLKNVATGSVANTLDMSTDLVSFGIGYTYPFSSYIRLNFGFDMDYAEIEPSSTGVTTRADYYNYGASIGLQIVIPSSAYVNPRGK